MRGEYLEYDRYDLQHATKELVTEMKAPTNEGWLRLKRLGRYLKGAPRCVQTYKRQSQVDDLLVDVDSDWAGDRASRKKHFVHCHSTRRQRYQDAGECNERALTIQWRSRVRRHCKRRVPRTGSPVDGSGLGYPIERPDSIGQQRGHWH